MAGLDDVKVSSGPNYSVIALQSPRAGHSLLQRQPWLLCPPPHLRLVPGSSSGALLAAAHLIAMAKWLRTARHMPKGILDIPSHLTRAC